MWFNQSDSVQLLPLTSAVVLTVVMVFSTWTITDRSYFNFQDGDNLTPDEVLLFGLWNVLFLWQCIPGSTTATCLPSHGRRRLPWPRPSRGSWCCSPTPSFGQNPKEQHIFLRIPSLMKYFSLVYFERLFAKLWTTCSLLITVYLCTRLTVSLPHDPARPSIKKSKSRNLHS